MSQSVLVLEHVSKRFGRFIALDDVSFQIDQGDIYGLIGENGAGKTTLMKLITRLSLLHNGKITLLGESFAGHYQRALSRTGAVIEAPTSFEKLTVEQNLKITEIQHGLNDRQLLLETLKFVGLTEKRRTKVKSLSLGQRQRLGLAMALLPQPDFLILDEPINGLDPSGIIAFRKLLQTINQERQTTILISSHILSELYQVSTKFGFISHGHFLKEVTKQDLDQENKSGILLDVNDPALAARVLDEQSVGPFEVINSTQILISNLAVDTGVLNTTLVQHGVVIKNMVRQHGSLETYYTNLIRQAGGERRD